MNDTRWRESLANLGEALDRLGEVLEEPVDAKEYVIDATIQRFEFTVELFWKTLKHLIALHGKEVALPLDALRQAYAAGWIDNEALWIGMMRDRNLTSHIYKKELVREIYGRISEYYPEMRRAYISIRDLHSSDK